LIKREKNIKKLAKIIAELPIVEKKTNELKKTDTKKIETNEKNE